MSSNNRVVWSEGLFLRPHHLQQNDRYVEHLLEQRVGHATPYPWGFSSLEIDHDLAQQSKFSLRRASGVMPGMWYSSTPPDVAGVERARYIELATVCGRRSTAPARMIRGC